MENPVAWIAAFCFTFFVWQTLKMWRGIVSFSWPAVLGTVQNASIEERDQGDGDVLYSACVQYTYRVDGKTYTSNRLTYSDTTQLSHEHAVELLRGISVGTQISVFYNGDRPAESVIRKGVNTPTLIKMGLFGVLAIASAIFALRGRAT